MERVLIERPGLGRTEQFAETGTDESFPPGAIVQLQITDATDRRLFGRPLA